MSNLATLRPFVKGDPRFKTRILPSKKGPYLTPILHKLLNAKWEFHDKKIKLLIKDLKLKETIGTALVLRRILNGTEGDDLAIERIFDRIDGKVMDVVKHEEKDPLLENEIEIVEPSGNGHGKEDAVNRYKAFIQ